MRRERRRKAGLDNVDSVNGRNKRTCKKLDNLRAGVRTEVGKKGHLPCGAGKGVP